jgi:hypothetical protein
MSVRRLACRLPAGLGQDAAEGLSVYGLCAKFDRRLPNIGSLHNKLLF